jgi:hypothetical protein
MMAGVQSPPLSLVQRQQVRAIARGMIAAEVETKAFDTTSNSFTVSTAGSVLKLTTVTQGATQVTRVGDRLKKKLLSFKYSIQVGATGLIAAADQYNTVRVIIFQWHMDDGLAAPVVANILTSTPTNKSLAMYNYDTDHDYKILYDRSHVVYNTPIWNGAAVQWNHGDGGTFCNDKVQNIALKGDIEFDAGSSFGTGHLYALFISDSAFAPNPSCEFVSRLLFEDS